MSNPILVTGGAGYIGSHTVLHLLKAGYDVVVVDNFYSGHRWATPEAAEFYQGDIHNRDLVAKIIRQHNIDSVIHFAGHIVVPESVENPAKYYQNNVVGSLNLIDTCVANNVNHFIFSSSAAVYGVPASCPVNEQATPRPINPYGTTKLMTEWTLRDFSMATSSKPFNYVALRYFNVAGAHIDGGLGQSTPEATHLIKVACQTACGMRPYLSIFGDDYPTTDGSCIRDYIHVDDLAVAHLDALCYLHNGGESNVLNCGYGYGFSVKQVIDCVKTVSNVDFEVQTVARRAGDPPELIADNKKIKRVLNWQPRHDELATICRSAYRWEQNLSSQK